MFVCHGNICRSPMAEFILKDMVAKKGIADKFLIASSATSREEIGNPVYPPARERLLRSGISPEGKRAVQVTKQDYENYDLLICMDRNNLRNITRIIPTDPQNKIKLLMDYAGEHRDVADPWYTGDFEITYVDIEKGCKALLKHLGL